MQQTFPMVPMAFCRHLWGNNYVLFWRGLRHCIDFRWPFACQPGGPWTTELMRNLHMYKYILLFVYSILYISRCNKSAIRLPVAPPQRQNVNTCQNRMKVVPLYEFDHCEFDYVLQNDPNIDSKSENLPTTMFFNCLPSCFGSLMIWGCPSVQIL